ncbi:MULTISPECIES: hypothetical protein [Bacillus]|uniref:hypothetical protein n=1 Tax=Bacillus TaxID=1386 RepID=UPI0014781717|nr:hypothetical protein [Bacillus thuringiensis]MCU5539867.1 hypothetical protein [Bacillus cereus]NNG93863.1 hypothetical protein [Bacillus thuringiensis]HDR6956463.1 hypothetical protein [Bacillus cereus]HDR7692521.1 hypothetical protein [Bacillus thuringiensis]
MKGKEWNFVNSHEKVVSWRESSMGNLIKSSLCKRMNNSEKFLLLGKSTKLDDDFMS